MWILNKLSIFYGLYSPFRYYWTFGSKNITLALNPGLVLLDGAFFSVLEFFLRLCKKEKSSSLKKMTCLISP